MYAGRVVERGPTRVLFHDRRHPTPRACCGRSPACPTRGTPGSRSSRGGRQTWWRCPSLRLRPRCRYAQARCLEERPELVDVGQDHEHACFFPVGTPEGGEALARNVAARESAAGLPVADDATVDVTTLLHGGGLDGG